MLDPPPQACQRLLQLTGIQPGASVQLQRGDGTIITGSFRFTEGDIVRPDDRIRVVATRGMLSHSTSQSTVEPTLPANAPLPTPAIDLDLRGRRSRAAAADHLRAWRTQQDRAPETQDQLRKTLPNVQVATIPDTVQYPSDGKPAAFLAIVDCFLAR